MRVGVMSDSHDRVPAVAELLRQMAAGGVSMVLHAGDYCSPFVLKPFEDAQMTLAGVFGRNDGDPEGLSTRAGAGLGLELFESPHSFDVGGERILIVHDIGDVQKRSLEAHSIVIHGATHQQEMKHRGDTLILNPGEACGWLFGTPQAAILDLEGKHVEFLSLDPAHWKR
ncbi:MAG: metallophosphoesterase [Gemmatimonadota bacterium]|nr:metallophosphoesterase [Gemmatimonadota bacterium]MDE3126847.1 metallophosphoesterase [Gemmatimonadota bacterium]MDE3173462.1 metallophosphoesterase [Gemmatimonadota bacterium]MDE3215509.1 metallophosphoesterase [Gemmatimonadota bacterium]